MSKEVYWLLELEIQNGKNPDFDALMNEMVEATKANEPGTLNYEWSTSEDGKQCHIYERYTDSEALLTHLGNFGEKFAERFLAILKPVGFQVYGPASPAVKEALAGFSPTYMNAASGFKR